MTVDLEVFIYYKLKAARLAKLVKNFPSKNYHSKFVKVASSAIKNVRSASGTGQWRLPKYSDSNGVPDIQCFKWRLPKYSYPNGVSRNTVIQMGSPEIQ